MKLRLIAVHLIVAVIAFAAALATVPAACAQPAPQPPRYGTTAAAPPATAPPAAPATANTVTTTGPVTSDTTISVGTVAGAVLTWVTAIFGVPIGTLITAWLYRAFALAGVRMTDAMRARLQEIVVNGINLGVKTATAEAAGKGQVEIRNAAIAHTIAYVQAHAADELRALGIDPNSNAATDAITARILTAINDANAPTPKTLATT